MYAAPQVYQGEGWLILSNKYGGYWDFASVSRGGVVDFQRLEACVEGGLKCIKGRGG